MPNLDWQAVPGEVTRLVKAAASLVPALRHAAERARKEVGVMPGYGDVWLNPDTKAVFFSLGDSDEREAYTGWTKALKLPGVTEVSGESEASPPQKKGPWVKVATAPDWDPTKINHVASPLAELLGLKEGPINAYWGGPRPLASTLAGGAIGAGAGYGAGWLAENLMPGAFEKHKLRRSLALMGGVAGAVPGMLQSADNLSSGKSVIDKWPPDPVVKQALAELEEYAAPPASWATKSAALTDFEPLIRRDGLNRAIMSDPYLDRRDSAATAGLVEAAGLTRNSPFITPFDIARVAVGMGTGLASGMIVGRVLGAFAGLSDPAQQQLQRAGVLAGLVRTVAPLAFGGR